GVDVTRRHEVDHPDGAGGGVPLALQDERVGPVAAPVGHRPAGRAEPPVAVAVVAEQTGEAGGGVEPGQAEPVDGTVPADQCRRLHVTDERVVLDPHALTLASAAAAPAHVCRTGDSGNQRVKSWVSGPMANAKAIVPSPAVPPSSHPAASTVTSMRNRLSRTDRPSRIRPVMMPSRGPAPTHAPMYRTVASAIEVTARATKCQWSVRGSCGVRRACVNLEEHPML